MENREFAQRIIRTADEYHFAAEEYWKQLLEIEPADDVTLSHFKELARNAILLYARAYLVLTMIETDEDQTSADLLEIIAEGEPTIGEFLRKNDVISALSEESTVEYSRIFSVAEALRSLLFQSSGQIAASLPERFSNPE